MAPSSEAEDPTFRRNHILRQAKSISGDPATIRCLKLASARKRIFKLALERSPWPLATALGEGFGKLDLPGRHFLPEPFLILQVRLNLVFVFKVEGDRAVDSEPRAGRGTFTKGNQRGQVVPLLAGRG